MTRREGDVRFGSKAGHSGQEPPCPLYPVSLTPLSIQQSLYWHERRSTLVLDQKHKEFRRIGTACVPVNDMNIVRAFIEGLSWTQCYLLSTLQLHHNGAQPSST